MPLLKTLKGHIYNHVTSLAIDKNGLLASGSWDSTIKLWNTTTGLLLNTLNTEGQTEYFGSVAFDKNGLLASASWNEHIGTLISNPKYLIYYAIKFWKTTTGQLLNTLEGHTDYINSVAFDQKGLLASGSTDKTINVWKKITCCICIECKGRFVRDTILRICSPL